MSFVASAAGVAVTGASPGAAVTGASPAAAVAVAPGSCPEVPDRVAIGAPDYSDPFTYMGAVEVRDGGAAQLVTRTTLGQGADSLADRFGSAVSRVELGAGVCQLLIVGAPERYGHPGRVYLGFDGPGGFGTGAATLVLTAPVQHLHEGFGRSLAVTPRRPVVAGVTDVDLWVGATGRRVGVPGGAGEGEVEGGEGAIERFRLTYDSRQALPELVVTHLQTLTQDSPGIPDDASPGDRFGEVLVPALAGLNDRWGLLVGSPHEDVTTSAGPQPDAGMVTAITIIGDGTPIGRLAARAITQATPGVVGIAEATDQFGAAVIDRIVGSPVRQVITVGTPGEGVGAIKDAGAVQDTEGLSLGQRVNGLQDRPERSDRFGAALAWAQPPRPCGSCPLPEPELVVGVPGEDVGAVRDAGAVQFGNTLLWQGKGFGGTAERGDLLGDAVAVQADGSLLVGSPGEDLHGLYNTGQAYVVPRTATAAGLVRTPAVPFTLAGGPARAARYGGALGR